MVNSRIVLIAAAAIALGAVGVSVWRARPAPAVTPPVAKQQGEVGDMVATLEARLKANPNDADGWRMLGWSFFETGRFAESATAYKRATALDPSKADYWSSLGEALVLAGGGNVPPDARAAFGTALQRDPKDPRARYFLAVAKDMDGNHKGAIDDWIALLQDTPSGAPWEADVRRIVTEVAGKEKIDISGRLAMLRPATPTGPAAGAIPGPTPEQMRSASQLPSGQQEAMVKGMVDGLAAKLEANPKNPDGWIMLMRSYTQLGRQREASVALGKAKSANPGAAAQLDAAAKELGVG